MFTPSSIITQLMTYLPKLTNIFCDNTAVVADVVAGSPQVLNINLTGHGLTTGQSVTLANSLINNPITGVAQYTDSLTGNKILRFTTAAPHDLICNKALGDIDTATLKGFTDTGLNSSFLLFDVSDKNHFDIVYATLPTLNTNEVLQVFISNGLDGVWPVVVDDDDNFHIVLTGAMYIDPQTVPQLNVCHNFRIWPAYDWEEAKQIYTGGVASSKASLFVIMGDCRASKDINIQSDARQTNVAGNEQRIKMINTFSLNLVIPTTDSLSGAEAVELAWSSILLLLIKSVSGIKFTMTANSNYLTTLIDHGPVEYNHAYYAHGYTWEFVYEVSNIETFLNNFNKTVAFRDIDFSFLAPQDTGSNLKLDE